MKYPLVYCHIILLRSKYSPQQKRSNFMEYMSGMRVEFQGGNLTIPFSNYDFHC
jgi:hypothetical protein